jgi:pSer/pThr/pTyr-binding forkhead associated (FHA) protein
MSTTSSPFGVARPAGGRHCHACGHLNSAAAAGCGFCGEVLRPLSDTGGGTATRPVGGIARAIDAHSVAATFEEDVTPPSGTAALPPPGKGAATAPTAPRPAVGSGPAPVVVARSRSNSSPGTPAVSPGSAPPLSGTLADDLVDGSYPTMPEITPRPPSDRGNAAFLKTQASLPILTPSALGPSLSGATSSPPAASSASPARVVINQPGRPATAPQAVPSTTSPGMATGSSPASPPAGAAPPAASLAGPASTAPLSSTGKVFGGAAARTKPLAPAVPMPATPSASPRTGPAEPRLIAIRRDGSEGQSYFVEDGADLGRTEGDITFADDHFLSPRHARISASGGELVLRDLGSVNGVFVRLRAPVELHDGDQFIIGTQLLRFEALAAAEATLGAAFENGVAIFGTPSREAWGRLRQMTVHGVARNIYHLLTPEVVLGRSEGEILFPEDEYLSRRHAQVSVRPARPGGGIEREAVLSDLGSANGILVRIRSPHPLVPGDHVRLGDQLFRFER